MNAHITCVISLPIKFSCSYVCKLEFFVTKLEGTYPAVLGYSWLTYYKPIIDWIEGIILCLNSNTSSQTIPSVQTLELDAISPIELLTSTSRVPSSLSSKNPTYHPIPNSKDSQAKDLVTNRPIILFVNAIAEVAVNTRGFPVFFLDSSSPTTV